jgi:hypothetical protein
MSIDADKFEHDVLSEIKRAFGRGKGADNGGRLLP